MFTGITPTEDFKPFRGGWGAWELAARVSYLDLNDGPIGGGEEQNVTVALNGCLRTNVRVMLNYIHARIKNRHDPIIDEGTANILQARFQIQFLND
ncbi:MAG: OprO/OprP family phosphate-selective porin [Desulfobacteraceae bacterium]|nr:OprO/OprP family phosphate-selective porin [Desulfobacteraceae bacterium]